MASRHAPAKRKKFPLAGKHQAGQDVAAVGHYVSVPRGFVRFWSPESSLAVLVRLGNGPAQITGGVGVYDQVERFGLPPVVVWQGQEPLQQTVPVLFDGDGAAVETGIGRMRALAEPMGRHRPPPLIRISGPGLHDKSRLWVITGLDPDDDVRRYGPQAQREWQPYVVTLLHHPQFEVTVQSAAKRNAADKRKGKGGRGSRVKHWTVRRNDTLPRIAKEVYGDAGKWHRIAEANKIRDPRHLKVGDKLRIP